MFFGESSHTLDAKHRVFVPKRFQEALDRDDQGHLKVVLSRGFERCLFLFSASRFQEILQRLRTQPFGAEETRRMQRLFFANTHYASLDGSGRLVLPEKLRTFAGIQKEVAMVGVADRAEIWDRAEWERFEESNAEDFDKLGEVLWGPDGAAGGGGAGGA